MFRFMQFSHCQVCDPNFVLLKHIQWRLWLQIRRFDRSPQRSAQTPAASTAMTYPPLLFILSVCLAVIWRLNHKALDQLANLPIVVGCWRLRSEPHGAVVHCSLCKSHWIWQLIWCCPPCLEKQASLSSGHLVSEEVPWNFFCPSLGESFARLTRGRHVELSLGLSVGEHFGI